MKLTDPAISPDLARRIDALPGDPAATVSRAIAIGVQVLEEASREIPTYRGVKSLIRRAEAPRPDFEAVLREVQEEAPPICASRRAAWWALSKRERESIGLGSFSIACPSCKAIAGAWCKPTPEEKPCGLPVSGEAPFAALRCAREAGHDPADACASSAELRTLALPFAAAVST